MAKSRDELTERIERLERAVNGALFNGKFATHQLGALRVQILHLRHETDELARDIERLAKTVAGLARTVQSIQRRIK